MEHIENTSLENYPSFEEIDQDNLPEIIKEQIRDLTELEEKKNKSSEDAEKAKQAADEMKGFVKKKFIGIEYNSGNTKEIIADMQKVIQLVAEAQESNAQATAFSFKFMQQLTKSSEYLFSLGCFNFATTEVMIKELTSYGKNLTGHVGISDAIKEKMLEVAKRLNMQKDLMLRQNKLEEKLRKLEEELCNNNRKLHDLEEVVAETTTITKKHKWLFWIIGGIIIALVILLLVFLI